MKPEDLASRLQLAPGPWATVLEALCARFPGIPAETWLERMQAGRVLDTLGKPIAPGASFRVGLELRYFREVPDEAPVPFQATLLHRDPHLLVADKPHFLPVVPGGRYLEQTLLRRLQREFDLPDLVPLHRLDRLTAGLVMFSLQPGSRDAYQSLFRTRRIHKTYQALAPPLPDLVFPHVRASRIVPGEPFFRMREVTGEANSWTELRVLEQAGPVWRYELRPLTGRKHQLRLHMAGLGAPILGDPLYPALTPQAPDDHEAPLQLLASALAFDDPLTGEPRRFESRLGLRLA